MRRLTFTAYPLIVALLLFPTVAAVAHPASGIVVGAGGEVIFVASNRGVCRIGEQGELFYLHRDTGGHFMALDSEGAFSHFFNNGLFKRITPVGAKPTLLFASGGAPLVVNRDGNLYYGSGFPDGDDMAPGGLTLTRLSPDGKRSLFAPSLKGALAELKEAVTGLAAGPDGVLYVACPNAILKVKTDGSVATFVHPVVVPDRDDAFEWATDSPFFHAPYLRGLDVAPDGTVYAAVTGCRCLVKIKPDGTVETILKSERPWTPTGVVVHGQDLFVLEYDHIDRAKGWLPRVRKLGADGKATTLVTISRDEPKGQP